MIVALLLSCATEEPLRGERVEAVRLLRPVSTTQATRVEAPGAPSGCITTIRVSIDYRTCEERWPSSQTDTRWIFHDGNLDGVSGKCAFMCLPAERRAQWLVQTTVPGWRGAARCAVSPVGDMTVQVVDYVAGMEIDPAVGATWLTPAGAESWGMAPVRGPDGGVEQGITENGCPAGQPSRPQ